MNNETELGLSLWEKIKDFVPEKKREDLAVTLLGTLDGFLDEFDIAALRGEDAILDAAIAILVEDEGYEDEEDEEW